MLVTTFKMKTHATEKDKEQGTLQKYFYIKNVVFKEIR